MCLALGWVGEAVGGAEEESPQAVLRASGQAYLESLERSGRVRNDPALDQHISDTLAAMSALHSVRVVVTNDYRPMALAVPENVIVISTGLLLAIADQSELAGVLAHELAHHLDQHHLRQWETARELDLSRLNKLPWLGPRRRATALSGFSVQLEREADRRGEALLGGPGGALGLSRVLARLDRLLPAVSGRATHPDVAERIAALTDIPLGSPLEPSPLALRYSSVSLDARRSALEGLRLRRQSEPISKLLADPSLVSDWPQSLRDAATNPQPRESWEGKPLVVSEPDAREYQVTGVTLMDGWTMVAPRHWRRRRGDEAVRFDADGEDLHRIDARCAAPTRAFQSLAEPASDNPLELIDQLRADLLIALDEFRAVPTSSRQLHLADGAGVWVEVRYRDARGLEHVVTSGALFSGAYYCELRWSTPRLHFHGRDEPVFLDMLASLRKP